MRRGCNPPGGHQRTEQRSTIVDLRRENARLSGMCAQQQRLAAQNDVLRREGDHRIKNSLQILASLLGLEARHEESQPAQRALTGAIARIQAVARMHDAMQLSGASEFDLGREVTVMCQSLQGMAGESGWAKIVVLADPLTVPALFGQCVTLAVNELVLNALRHAFPDGRKGIVLVEVSVRGDDACVTVADDGVGIDPNRGDARGYGTKLVLAMTEKIRGRLDVECAGGTRITLRAPLPPPAAAPHTQLVWREASIAEIR